MEDHSLHPLIAQDEVLRALAESDADAHTSLQQLTETLAAQQEAHAQEIAELEQRVIKSEGASDDRIRSILKALSDGLCTLDREGRCMSLNTVASRYLGTSEDVVGQKILGRFKLSPNHESSPHVYDLLWTSIRERLALRFEQALLMRKDGSQLAISCVFNPLIEHDEVIGCVFVFRDVSAQRRNEEELRQLNDALLVARDKAIEASRSKSTFLANMSHELRTPLNAIIGYSELVKEDAEIIDGAGAIVDDIDKIHTAADHLLHIINDILDVSKIEAGKMELFTETFSVEGLVDSVAQTVDGLVSKNHNKLEVVCEDDVGSMHSDKLKLRQSLLNLVSNAAKFTDDGAIRVHVRREFTPRGDWIIFEVSDEGIGIPRDRIEHLFDSFTQADQSTTRRYGGTGLGLTITYQFCHMLGGEISVESEVDEGSVFTIRLPAVLYTGRDAEDGELSLEEPTSANAHDDAYIDGIADEVAQTKDTRAVVLSIDDDPTVTELIERFLPAEEFKVVRADGGQLGLRMARRLNPDVITLDVMMPEVDGWTVLSRLKSDPELATVPVVMLTITAERQRGYALGATDYLTKPIQRSRLVDVLRRYCSIEGSVMVVEDDTETRNILHRVLENAGWRTLEARHGEEALELLESEVPDVILLDLMMPEMDGFQVLDQLRSVEAWQHIPVIVLTAMELSVDELQRLNRRVTQVFQKGSTSTKSLVDQIRHVACAPRSS